MIKVELEEKHIAYLIELLQDEEEIEYLDEVEKRSIIKELIEIFKKS